MNIIMKPHHKYNILSISITAIIIFLLILSGPVSAIDVSLVTPNIDVSTELTKTFMVKIKVNDGEFLPILKTDLEFEVDNEKIICQIDKDNNISGCDFLAVESREISDLYSDYGYGYGYGYDYTPNRRVSILEGSENYGYQKFGYGYGYGYSGGEGYGTIKYVLTINILKLPDEFIKKEVDVEAIVYGGTEDDFAYFKGKSKFYVSESLIDERPEVENPIDRTKNEIVNYEDIILDIPSETLPEGTTRIIVKRTNPIKKPVDTNLKILGKTYNFDIDNIDKTFSKEITITLSYTDEELYLIGLTDESKIVPAYYDNNLGDWIKITSGIIIDALNNQISFKVNHFTQFTLLADMSIPVILTPGLRDEPRVTTPEAEEKPDLALLTYPNCREDADCPAGETCSSTGGYYKQCVPIVTEALVAVPEAGAPTPTGAAITGAAIAETLGKHPVIATIIIIIVLALIIACYFYFRSKKYK